MCPLHIVIKNLYSATTQSEGRSQPGSGSSLMNMEDFRCL